MKGEKYCKQIQGDKYEKIQGEIIYYTQGGWIHDDPN